MPWLSLEGCIYGGPYFGMMAGLWAVISALGWGFDYRTYTGLKALLPIAARSLRLAKAVLAEQALPHGPLRRPFAVATDNRIQNTAFQLQEAQSG